MNTTDNEDSQQSIDRLLRSIISERMAKEYLIEESGYPQDAEERHYFNTEAGKEYQDLLVNKAKSSLLELILSCVGEDEPILTTDDDIEPPIRNELRAEIREAVKAKFENRG